MALSLFVIGMIIFFAAKDGEALYSQQKQDRELTGLDLIDRVPDELWMEDHVQEAGIKTIPMEKKCKRAKKLFEEDLHIVVITREVKSKGEKEK